MPVNTQMKAVLDRFLKLNPPAIELLSPENARNAPTLKNAVEEMAAERLGTRAVMLVKPSLPEPVGSIRHLLIPGPAGEILVRVFTPEGDGPFPVLVYFHGGGFVFGNLDVYEPSCRALCNAVECIVVSVAYRLAPGHKFPAATQDACAATQWVIENAARLNGYPELVAVAGESAGGNLATVTCLKTLDVGGAMPVAQLLIYPVTDSRMSTPSYAEFTNAVPLKTAMIPWFWKHYLENPSQGDDPYASPMCATNLKGLPPAIVITAEMDPLRDDGEAYARKLAAAGVPVEAKRYNGVTHEFFGLAGVVDTARNALESAAAELRRIFTQIETPAIRRAEEGSFEPAGPPRR